MSSILNKQNLIEFCNDYSVTEMQAVRYKFYVMKMYVLSSHLGL